MENIPERFRPGEIESKWQEKWDKERIYSPDMKNAKKPYYNLMMFPYPSAEGLHIGNMYAFTGVDIHGRFMRMRGFDVFEPIGLDGFGIHSENYAIKVGRTPQEHAHISQKNFYRQLHAIGNGFDWTRSLETYDTDYYRWTQWLFVQMFKHGLAYRAKAKVNWCPNCKTVLADEQVVDGVCERCSTPVVKKDLEQWFFRITHYAERLLQNTYKPQFKWTEKVKIGQRNWIGKKEGINIKYQISNIKYVNQKNNKPAYIEVFTTAPVNFGMTFLVLSPDHSLIGEILSKKTETSIDRYKEIRKYVEKALHKTEEDRIAEARDKTGVFTGLYVINPVNKHEVPVWVSDFVVKGVGTGAVQGCPGHDYKDFEFAKKFNLPIPRVVVGPDGDVSEIDTIDKVIVSGMKGKMINSDFLNGMEFSDALQKTMDYFESKGWGKRVVTFHMRDWLISRQRYWGAPIPMVYCQKCAKEGKSWFTEYRHSESASAGEESTNKRVKSNSDGILTSSASRRTPQDDNVLAAGWFPVPEDQLPVLLPDVKDWKPTGTGRGPLAGHPEFYKTKCPHCGSPADRETDVCDTFLDSSWYYLRYPFVDKKSDGQAVILERSDRIPNVSVKSVGDSITHQISSGSFQNDKPLPWDNGIIKRWVPIDSYIGGAEHTVLHLLYTRFVWMALRDWGYLEVNEPQNGEYDPDEPFKRFYAHGLIIKDGAKMSKSKGNVVVPDEYIKLYGADTLRTYLMFLGPFDGGGDFRDSGIEGMYRFLSRVWRELLAVVKNTTSQLEKSHPEAVKVFAKTIKGVGEDLESLHYNTAIAKLMECMNWWVGHRELINLKEVREYLLILAPFAPHLCEELYQKIKNQKSKIKTDKENKFESIHVHPWPTYETKDVVEDMVTVVVQVNGRLRDGIVLPTHDAQQQPFVEELARKSEKVQKWIAGKNVKKVIFIPGKLINFVV